MKLLYRSSRNLSICVCSPHSLMGMIGIVIVANNTSNKEVINNYDIGGRAI